MSLSEIITPVYKDHSIKEAVISLFLATPIIKPERFNELIEKDFKDKFQQFNPVAQVQLQIKGQKNVPANISQQVLANVGFRFVSFEKGKQVKVLQGINETARNFISYHSLNYTRWAFFLADYLEVIRVISAYHPGMFITGTSLHYIDEFLWNSESKIDLKLLFNTGGDYLPKEFFNSDVSNYSIVTNKERYFDRLEILIESIIKPSISISHNVTQTFSEPIELRELLSENEFEEVLNLGHRHNKDILNDILRAEVKQLIKLTE